jgi:hypothetical protein
MYINPDFSKPKLYWADKSTLINLNELGLVRN